MKSHIYFQSPANTETEVPAQTTQVKEANDVKENDSPEMYSDKKTDEIIGLLKPMLFIDSLK